MAVSVAEAFQKNGYIVLKSLYTQEEVKRLKEEAAAVMSRPPDDKIGVFLGLAPVSELFKQAAAAPALADTLKAIIGPQVRFLNDKLVLKNAETDFGSPWHQDYPYWHGSHKLSVWIALDDANPDNGCLRVVPGSHLQGSIDHDGDASDGKGFVNRLTETAIDPSQVVDLPAASGDAIVFHDLLLHSSYPNRTGADRWALISTYKDGTQPDPEYAWAKAAFDL